MPDPGNHGRRLPAVAIILVSATVLVSGGTVHDPQTPPGIPGLAAPFLGVAVTGDGGLTAAIDAYGDVVDMRAPGPAGRPLIDNPSARQSAGTVPTRTGIVPRLSIDGGPRRALWRADSIRQRYLPRTNVLLTRARFGDATVRIEDAARGQSFARDIAVSAPRRLRVVPTIGLHLEPGIRCEERRRPRRLSLLCLPGESPPAGPVRQIIESAERADRRWVSRALPLARGAPGWARRMYRRSLLAMRALSDGNSGAAVAGARDGWAYVWPRDAAAVALALGAAGYRSEAARVARFVSELDLGGAARFDGHGGAVDGRAAQGDAAGWANAAALATRCCSASAPGRQVGAVAAPSHRDAAPHRKSEAANSVSAGWRARSDYQEKSAGDFLANAIASAATGAPGSEIVSETRTDPGADRASGAPIAKLFGSPRGLVRAAGEPGSGVDSAAAWAVRPFSQPRLFALAHRSLNRLLFQRGTRFGIVPSEDWPGEDPWTAPTGWSAWALASLGDRRAAIALLGDLRRAATPAGLLPERVGARIGAPRSTTPLAWSHAFAALALLQLWSPARR